MPGIGRIVDVVILGRLMMFVNKCWLAAFLFYGSMANAGHIDTEFFGIHVLKFHDPKMLPAVNYGAVRLWDSGTTWAHIQPERNKWNWSRLDLAIKGVYKKKDILLTLGMTPAWASSNPGRKSFYGNGQAAMPAALGDWELYVRKVVERYGNRISAIEVWNEPESSGFFQGSVSDLVALTRIVRKVVDAHSYKIKVVAPAFADVEKMESFLQAGGANYVDVIGVHLYSYDPYPEAVLNKVSRVYAMLEKYKIQKPVWNTESGYDIASLAQGRDCHDSNISASAFLARWYIQLAASEIKRFYWYTWDHDKLGLVFRSGQPKNNSAIATLNILQRWLIGNKVEKCTLHQGLWRCKINKSKTSMLIWADRAPVRLSTTHSLLVESLWGEKQRVRSDFMIGFCPMLISQ